eukprot:3189782-Amphidinium_carterae.1
MLVTSWSTSGSEEQKKVKKEDMELLTDPESGVVMVPNIHLDDLVVVPEPESNTTSYDVESIPELISVRATASVYAHYETVNDILEDQVFEDWTFVAEKDRKPAGWQDGFDIIIQELNANLIENDISYPTERGAVNGNPYDISRSIAEEAHNKSIEQFRWNMADMLMHGGTCRTSVVLMPTRMDRSLSMRTQLWMLSLRSFCPCVIRQSSVLKRTRRTRTIMPLQDTCKLEFTILGIWTGDGLDMNPIIQFSNSFVTSQTTCNFCARASSLQRMAGTSHSPNVDGRCAHPAHSTYDAWQDAHLTDTSAFWWRTVRHQFQSTLRFLKFVGGQLQMVFLWKERT